MSAPIQMKATSGFQLIRALAFVRCDVGDAHIDLAEAKGHDAGFRTAHLSRGIRAHRGLDYGSTTPPGTDRRSREKLCVIRPRAADAFMVSW